MARYSLWIGAGLAIGIIAALAPMMTGDWQPQDFRRTLKRLSEAPSPPVELAQLDLTRVQVAASRVTTELPGGREVELTLDPDVQRAAQRVMRRYRVPEAGVVAIDVRTGNLQVYASQVLKGQPFDVNLRSEAPAASIFKLVTGAALIEVAGLHGDTEQCYRGGRSRIIADELAEDPERDHACTSLKLAMGRSTNVVFARLAQKHLTPKQLGAMGGALGFGVSVPFVLANEPAEIDIPEDGLEFARAAAGFWHSTLSPLAAASLAQTIANRGVTLRPRIARRVVQGDEVVWEDEGDPEVVRRALRPETARELTRMMVQTVASGSAFKVFHDERGQPFLPGMQVAGKTGTLTRHEANRHYTWFVGFAPAHAPELAISVLVVNTPVWRIKAHQLAREVLRAHFAKQGWPGVSAP